MIRVTKERTRNALVWAWIRFWRQPLRRDTITNAEATSQPFVETPGGLQRVEDKAGYQGQGESNAQDRQQQASKLVRYFSPAVPLETYKG